MADEFTRLIATVGSRKLPPVESWQPETIGEIDITIRRDGVWFHEGREIKRQSIVNLFSSVLRREENQFFLVTPVEKLKIEVEDVPFVAVAMEVDGTGANQRLLFTTNCGDHVLAGSENPVRMGQDRGEQRPYLMVRNNLDALICRSVFYRLANLVEGDDEMYLVSDGVRFPLGHMLG